ncbi:MAG: hypothetical protein JWO97_3320 [Acidobacteria bacterium]|nr:hypothetical protein [Acidobacteriota bacterium]
MSNLGKIFNSGVVNDIEVLFDDVEKSGVLDPVGTDAFALPQVKVATADPSVKVFDLTADLDASAQAQVSILASGATITPYDSSAALSAPAGSSYAQLSVTGSLNAGATGTVNETVPLSISASGAASFAYNHYLPAAATGTRLAAFQQLAASAQLPQFASLAALKPGEVSSFEAPLNFDLGLKAKYGSSFDVSQVLQLFDGLSAQLTAQVQYSLEASLGWSIFDDMKMVVGSAQQNNAGWARIRIDRTHTNTFTTGATFALQVNYDASSIATALEKAFDMTALPRVIAVLTTASTITFATLQQTVIDEASNKVIELIAGTGWKTKAANDPTIVKALADINKVLALYNSVDAKVKQLWATLLTKVDLQPGSPLRTTIEKIAALDPTNPNLTQFLSPTATKDLELLESLSGKSIEQLLVGSGAGVSIAITDAVNLAKQLLRVITDTPTEVTTAIQQFEVQFGIKSAVDFLSKVSSLDNIEQFGDGIIRKVVAKAVGKVFTAIGPADFTKVQAWAKKIIAQWDALSAKLAAAAKFLKGQVGFSVALEFSRVSSFSAVLDFEVNPQSGAAIAAIQAQLPRGNVADILAALNGLDRATFEIREAVIISRHLRTGATTVILSLLGLQNLQKITTTRFDESVIRVTNAGRQASYSGGFVQAVSVGASGECSTSIGADASDAQTDPRLPFAAVSRSLRLTFAHHSMSSTQSERTALVQLLGQLGFIPSTGAPGVDAADGAETVFAMNITLDGGAVVALVSDLAETTWNNDYRNSATRLLREALFDTRKLGNVDIRVVDAEADVVGTELWTDTWTDSSRQKFVTDPRAAMLSISGKPLDVVRGADIIPPYEELQQLIVRRPAGLRQLDDLQNAVNGSSSGAPDALETLASAAASFFANTSLDVAENPMFNFWFVVARLSRIGAATLQNAKGLATLRTRASATADLSAPVQWTLTPAVGVPAAQVRTLFPFA